MKDIQEKKIFSVNGWVMVAVDLAVFFFSGRYFVTHVDRAGTTSGMIVAVFLSILAFSGMEATFALVAAHRYRLDERGVSWVFAFLGVMVVIVQGGLIGPLPRRFGETNPARVPWTVKNLYDELLPSIELLPTDPLTDHVRDARTGDHACFALPTASTSATVMVRRFFS